jgi:hypothetical protein
MAAPMVVDGGMGGLNQSLQHPQSGRSAYNADTTTPPQPSGDRAPQKNNATNLEKAVNDIVRLVDNDKKDASRPAIERLVLLVREEAKIHQRSSDAPVTKGDLRELLDLALKGQQQAKP